ncbi:MAG: acetyl-CoA carboxylase biotin carboxyl carrier protein [Lentisphaeraceae bacterium]|nr:acetyl-CoA carboxylase biotin carboxyl carrier protein [Lentisphaeraceae bacterium]
MDLGIIKQVIDLMNENKLTEFTYEEHDKYKLSLKQGGDIQTVIAAPGAAPAPQAAAPSAGPAPDAGTKVIESPLVGTFYAAPSPEAPAYTQVGDKIEEGSIICIVEAMKVMNEIVAEFSGTVTEILVNNGDPVEYGQPLFRVKAD